MKKYINSIFRPLVNSLGIQITKYRKYLEDYTEKDIRIWEAINPYTMTSPERVRVLTDSVRYIIENNIEGATVECGVWKGGSTMAMALSLKEMGVENREIYLYDTFAGMSAPTEYDVSSYWGSAEDKFSKKMKSDDASDWCFSPLDEVKTNVLGTGYPEKNFHLDFFTLILFAFWHFL